MFRLFLFARLSFLALLPALLAADDHWIALKSGPFEVLSDAGDRAAREKLMFLEQFRETLRIVTGKQELRLVWPVQLLLVKNASEIPNIPKQFALARDTRIAAITESGGFSRESLKEFARILLNDNTNRLPDRVEDGILELVSTVQIDGVKITLGAPPPEAERSPGWALMHLVTVSPDYAGRARVMISNLEQSGDFDAACRNAYEKSAAQIEEQANAELKAGNFATISISGRALSPTRDFKPVQLGSDDTRIAMADLQLASGHIAEAQAAYTALKGPVGSEGLALLALRDQKDDQAKAALQDAVDGGTTSARACLNLGWLKSDEDLLKKASALNPRWGEPYFQLADLNPAVDKEHLEQRAELLKKAANLNPRNSEYWQALAKTYEAAQDFAGAQKAWGGAEKAAANDEEREHIRKVRLDVQAKRYDAETAERKRVHDEAEADIARVKAQSDAEIHASEVAARKRMNPNGAAPPKPEGWYEAPAAGSSIQGTFQKLDCLDQRARLVIQTSDGKTTQLLMADPSQVSLGGGGEKTLSCGVQKNARQVTVQYNAKPDAKLHTAGEVIAIEFR